MMKTRRQALALMGSTALSACGVSRVAPPDPTDPFEGGIGGTGIVGTLNGFGSLLVNGLRVETGRVRRVRTAFGLRDLSALSPGQVLTISAEPRRGGLAAIDISLDLALVGTLRRDTGGLRVNGIRLIGVPTHSASDGARVAVSGVWTAEGVRPNRIDPAPDARDLIAGTIDDGAIGGLPLDLTGGMPRDGRHVVAIGRAVTGGFVASALDTGRFERLGQLDNLSVEGYLEPIARRPGFRIAGLGHNFARDVRLGAIGNRRALYFGRYFGLFGARKGYIIPDAFAARRAALVPGFDAGFAGPVIEI